MAFNMNCSSQGDGNIREQIDRQPFAAGRFYSDDPVELRSNLTKLFANAVPNSQDNVIAVISPHAGYVFQVKWLPLHLTKSTIQRNMKISLCWLQAM